MVLAALAAAGLIDGVKPAGLLGSLCFVRNYHMAYPAAAQLGGTYTGHFWSLSIEEHFYLLWPGLLALLRPRRSLYVASLGALLCALWRHHCFATADTTTQSLFFVSVRTDCRPDGLLIGCCLAILINNPSVRAWIARHFPKETPLLCGFPCILLISASSGLPSVWLYLLIAIALASTLLVHEGLVYKWLNLSPLVWIGRISYGLYVYQQIFLIHPPQSHNLPPWQLFPLNIFLVFLTATVSFYFFERPLTAMARRRLSAPTQQPARQFNESPAAALALE